jgi:hypothetical protein
MPRCTIGLLVTLALGFLVGPLTAQAQQAMRVYRPLSPIMMKLQPFFCRRTASQMPTQHFRIGGVWP